MEQNKHRHVSVCAPPIDSVMIMQTPSQIRNLVDQALTIRRLTPDLEQAISSELTRLGYLPYGDEEVLELLMAEMDAGRIQLVHSR